MLLCVDNEENYPDRSARRFFFEWRNSPCVWLWTERSRKNHFHWAMHTYTTNEILARFGFSSKFFPFSYLFVIQKFIRLSANTKRTKFTLYLIKMGRCICEIQRLRGATVCVSLSFIYTCIIFYLISKTVYKTNWIVCSFCVYRWWWWWHNTLL